MFWNRAKSIGNGYGLYTPTGALYVDTKEGCIAASEILQTSVAPTDMTIVDVYITQWMIHNGIVSKNAHGNISFEIENDRARILSSLSLFHEQRDRVEEYVEAIFTNCVNYNGREQIDFLYSQILSIIDYKILTRLMTGFYHGAVTVTKDRQFWPMIHKRFPYTWMIGRMQLLTI